MDAGRFIGDSAPVFVEEFKGEIHSFEPAAANYPCLLRVIALNKLYEHIIILPSVRERIL